MEFVVKIKLKASAKEIFSLWLSSEGHSKMTGGAASISNIIADKFTAWNGYISGKNLELEPHKRILQSWRTTEFSAEEEDSLLEILLTEIDGVAELTLTHSRLPESGEHYRKGWDVHYFQPMRLYFHENSA